MGKVIGNVRFSAIYEVISPFGPKRALEYARFIVDRAAQKGIPGTITDTEGTPIHHIVQYKGVYYYAKGTEYQPIEDVYIRTREDAGATAATWLSEEDEYFELSLLSSLVNIRSQQKNGIADSMNLVRVDKSRY